MQRRSQLNRRILVISIAAACVGLGVGMLATAFRVATQMLRAWISEFGSTSSQDAALAWLPPTLATAALAVAALWLVQRFAPESGGSGVQEIEGALAGTRPIRWRRVIPVKFFGAWMALGGGMALGREGPTVQMGGNFGEMFGELFGIGREDRHVLIAAGAAAGLAAAFNAPLSGVIFVVEEMRPEFRYGFLSFQSVLIASVCADVVTRLATSQAPLLLIPEQVPPALMLLPLFLVFGSLVGVVAVLFAKNVFGVLDQIARLTPSGRLIAAGLIGAIIGLLGWFDPTIVGGGYSTIRDVVNSSNTLIALLFMFLTRYVLTLACFGSGVPGGVFAPMLAMGTVLGMAFGLGVDQLVPGLVPSPQLFAVAGMAAFFSATVRAPITGIALSLEMTGDFGLTLALLVTCLSASLVAESMGSRPFYEVLLERSTQSATNGS
jgi:CIC family chloride channel protein